MNPHQQQQQRKKKKRNRKRNNNNNNKQNNNNDNAQNNNNNDKAQKGGGGDDDDITLCQLMNICDRIASPTEEQPMRFCIIIFSLLNILDQCIPTRDPRFQGDPRGP